jgi:hypothetical protein
MTDVVAIEEGLEDLGDFLRAHGFKVVDWKEENAVVDALIYKGQKLESIFSSTLGQGTGTLESSTGYPAGVLLVNAQGKTPQEVLKILTQRSYESFL